MLGLSGWSVGEILKVAIAAAHKIDIVSDS